MVYLDDNYTETRFYDNSRVPALANNDPESLKTAKDLGYKDTAKMSREHEILHTFLSEKCGLPYSPTLWSVAHDQENCIPVHVQYEEEAAILGFQKYLNLAVIDEYLDKMVKENNLDLLVTEKEARKILEFK